MEEHNLSILICPKGHDVTYVNRGAYHCATCIKDYTLDELQEKPVDRTNMERSPWNKPTRYGRID